MLSHSYVTDKLFRWSLKVSVAQEQNTFRAKHENALTFACGLCRNAYDLPIWDTEQTTNVQLRICVISSTNESRDCDTSFLANDSSRKVWWTTLTSDVKMFVYRHSLCLNDKSRMSSSTIWLVCSWYRYVCLKSTHQNTLGRGYQRIKGLFHQRWPF